MSSFTNPGKQTDKCNGFLPAARVFIGELTMIA